MRNLENNSTNTSTGFEQQLCNKSSTERRANLKTKKQQQHHITGKTQVQDKLLNVATKDLSVNMQ